MSLDLGDLISSKLCDQVFNWLREILPNPFATKPSEESPENEERRLHFEQQHNALSKEFNEHSNQFTLRTEEISATKDKMVSGEASTDETKEILRKVQKQYFSLIMAALTHSRMNELRIAYLEEKIAKQ